MIRIEIPEPIVPYTRMTQRSKYVNQAAHKYLASRDLLRWYMRQAMEAGDHTMLDKVPISCTLEIETTSIHKADLDNLIKAVLDAAQGIVFSNDRWVESILANQRLAEKNQLRFWVMEIPSSTKSNRKPQDEPEQDDI